jgi:hypothetical protein
VDYGSFCQEDPVRLQKRDSVCGIHGLFSDRCHSMTMSREFHTRCLIHSRYVLILNLTSWSFLVNHLEAMSVIDHPTVNRGAWPPCHLGRRSIKAHLSRELGTRLAGGHRPGTNETTNILLSRNPACRHLASLEDSFTPCLK